jgi:hypothetical protein
MAAFRAGTLMDTDKKRERAPVYQEVEEKLMEYIERRSRLYIRDKCGVSYIHLQEKARQYASRLGISDSFKASNGWLHKVLKRGNKKSVALHGEGMEMSPEMQVYELGVQQGDLPRIIEAWVDAEDDPVVIASDIDDMIDEIEEGTSIEMERDEEVEEAVNVEAAKKYVSWTDCLRSFDTIRCYLRDNKLKTINFEQAVESIRAERQDRATSQLSIRSFFSRK